VVRNPKAKSTAEKCKLVTHKNQSEELHGQARKGKNTLTGGPWEKTVTAKKGKSREV